MRWIARICLLVITSIPFSRWSMSVCYVDGVGQQGRSFILLELLDIYLIGPVHPKRLEGPGVSILVPSAENQTTLLIDVENAELRPRKGLRIEKDFEQPDMVHLWFELHLG
ncbi:hypothetical protein AKJ16_DCAP15574 [Drosera capensis]